MTAHGAATWRRALRWCGALVLACALIPAARALEPVRIDACQPTELDGRNVSFTVLPAGADGIEKAAAARFAPVTAHRMGFGMVRGSVWLSLSVVAGECPGSLLLQVNNTFATRAEIYRLAPGGAWSLVPHSEYAPAPGGGVRLRFASLPLALSPEGVTRFMVRVQGPSSVLVAPTIVPGADLHASAVSRMLVGGIFFGGILALATYCAFLAVVTRFRGLLAYSASAIALAGFYAIAVGLFDDVARWLAGTTHDPREVAMQINGVFVLFAALSHWFFVRGLLDDGRRRTISGPWAPVMFGGWGALLVAVPFIGGPLLPLVYVGTGLAAIAAIFVELARALRANHPLARVTLVACSALTISVLLYMGLFLGLLGWNPALVHVLAVGTLVEAILLAAAIGTHVKDLRGQKQQLTERTQELSLLSQIDPLTGLSNRRAYDAIVQVEIERCHRRGRTASLLVVDIDHFKQVNDNFGHAFGDSVIRMLGATIANSVRSSDYAFRYGGEEFVVLLPGLDKVMAFEISERIMREFTNCSPTAPDGTRPFFSVSIGLAQLRADDDSATLFGRADAAMYRAKQEGRCRTVVADEPAIAVRPRQAGSGA